MDRKEIDGQKQIPATMEAGWCSGVPGLLMFTADATRKLWELIGWHREDFPDNRKEQAGWLLGHYCQTCDGVQPQAEVEDVLIFDKTMARSEVYIEWPATEVVRLHNLYLAQQAAMAQRDPVRAENFRVLGWWHTHPGSLPVFLSGTDMETVRSQFFRPNQYSLVLNPHRGIMRAFTGAEAWEVPVVMLKKGKTGRQGSKKKKQNRRQRRAKQRR